MYIFRADDITILRNLPDRVLIQDCRNTGIPEEWDGDERQCFRCEVVRQVEVPHSRTPDRSELTRVLQACQVGVQYPVNIPMLEDLLFALVSGLAPAILPGAYSVNHQDIAPIGYTMDGRLVSYRAQLPGGSLQLHSCYDVASSGRTFYFEVPSRICSLTLDHPGGFGSALEMALGVAIRVIPDDPWRTVEGYFKEVLADSPLQAFALEIYARWQAGDPINIPLGLWTVQGDRLVHATGSLPLPDGQTNLVDGTLFVPGCHPVTVIPH